MCCTSNLSVEAATSQSQQAERHQNTEHQPITKHTEGREVTAVTRQHGGILVGLVILANSRPKQHDFNATSTIKAKTILQN